MPGRSIPLSRPRRIIMDLCVFSRATTKGVLTKRFDLGPLHAAMRDHPARPPWTALFGKAYALVARDMPQLRRAYVKLPTPRYYEYRESTLAVVTERDVEGEAGLFFAKVDAPERMSLGALGAELRRMKTRPVKEIEDFREALFIAGLPLPLRRALWWFALNFGPLRPGYFGSFGISTLAAEGAGISYAVHPLTALISYGPFDERGGIDVVLSFDHRVFDGVAGAAALTRLEAALNGPILEEIRSTAISIKTGRI